MEKAHTVFTSKAGLYARYRWDYAPAAVRIILERSGISETSRAADIGAGTGIFTRHLVGKAGFVVAVEPNPEMRRLAFRDLAHREACAVIAASAEATGLKTASIDLISAAQAVHWFWPREAQAEFARILKPGGWLAILRNYSEGSELQDAVGAFHTPEYGVTQPDRPVGRGTPREVYFGAGRFERLVFEFITRQSWDEFLGALLSASYAPDPGHALYPKYELAAREVFERFSRKGVLETQAVTELYLGQPEKGQASPGFE